MSSQGRALLWKEWREWQLPFMLCMVWMLAFSAISIAYDVLLGQRDPLGHFKGISEYYALVLPIFIAARVALGEASAATLPFSSGLPISLRRRAWVRLGSGAFVLVVPILASALVWTLLLLIGWIDQFDHLNRHYLSSEVATGRLWCNFVLLIWGTLSSYLCLAYVATYARKEHSGTFGGMMVILAAFIAYLMFGLDFAPGQRTLWAIGPFLPEFAKEPFTLLDFWGLLGSINFQLLFAHLFVQRYATRDSFHAEIPAQPKTAWMWPRWSLMNGSRTSSLITLGLRQAVPLCLAGLSVAFVMTATTDFGDRNGSAVGTEVVEQLPGTTWVIGSVWSIVVGVALFGTEMDTRVVTMINFLINEPEYLYGSESGYFVTACGMVAIISCAAYPSRLSECSSVNMSPAWRLSGSRSILHPCSYRTFAEILLVSRSRAPLICFACSLCMRPCTRSPSPGRACLVDLVSPRLLQSPPSAWKKL